MESGRILEAKLTITVTSGVGAGPTQLAAFDAALIASGVANYNLIPLSSVIPLGSQIRREKYASPENEYGFRLYTVISRHDEVEPGRMAWAAVGWVQELRTGRGLFVEHHGADPDAVRREIHASLAQMVSTRPYHFGPVEYEMAGVECTGDPVSAVALAVYCSAPWEP